MVEQLERFLPEMKGQIAYEHFHRYLLARDFVTGKSVLDVACGEGFGTALLSQKAKRVTGLDIDGPTIAAATERYGRPGQVEFVKGDCVSLPFVDGEFDVVTSFETIEHILDHAQLIAEIRRVLKPNGLLIISTPNKVLYSGAQGVQNSFHLKELDEKEFRTTLGGAFRHVRLFGQRFLLPSLIWPIDKAKKPAAKTVALTLDRAGEAQSVANIRVSDPTYFIAFCSTAPLAFEAQASLYLDLADDLWLENVRVLRWASSVHDETERLRALLREREAQLESQSVAIANKIDNNDSAAARKQLAAEIAVSRQTIVQLKGDLDAAKSEATALAGHLAALQGQYSAVAEERAQSIETIARIQDSLTHSEMQIDRLVGEADAHRALQENALEALRLRESELTALAAELVEEREGKRVLEAQFTSLNASFLAISGAMKAREQTLQTERKAHDQSLETERKARAEDLARAGADLETVIADRQQVEAQLTAAREALAAHESSAKAMKQEMLALQAALKERIAENERAAAATKLRLRAQQRAAENTRAALDDWSQAARANESALIEIKSALQVVDICRNTVLALQEAAARMRRHLATRAQGVFVAGAQLRPPRPLVGLHRTLSWLESRRFERDMQFDRDWYLRQNPDVAGAGIDPLKHYLSHGLREDRDPNPAFSAVWYRLNAPEAVGNMPAYAHFLADPARRAWPHHPLFDANYYMQINRALALKPEEAFDHFLSKGASESRNPHPLVDLEVLTAEPGLDTSKNAWLEYVTNPDFFHATPHHMFDASAYLTDNPDVANAQTHPLLHYVVTGWREGRAPHPLFASDWYLSANPDVLSAGVEPLEHYILSGAQEGRRPHPLFDPNFYVERNNGLRIARRNALQHYVLIGARQGFETTRDIDAATMRSITPAVALHRYDPITAFVRFGKAEIDIPRHFVTPGGLTGEAPQIAWPPVPQPAYWIPQGLRDYIIQRHGEDYVSLYVYLMSIVERFGDQPEQFAGSRELRHLRDRMETLVEKRAQEAAGIDVSIVIPVYNNLVFTLTSVISILEDDSHRTYEIIIGDDGSKDATPEVFGEVPAIIRLVRHEKNLGFLGNCNVCAGTARGRYVVMLNNDTLILPDWLDQLIDPFERDQRIGFTGSKLLNGDGTLQEAGGIFWRDGSAWNFGRNGDPRRPEFNYLKDVDYVSGASIALPRDLWESLGGFDPAFKPAYCEDSDIAFRVRARGLRTIYVPHSELIHHEGKSHGRDTESGIKAYQVENNKKLLARWKETLEAENFPNAEHVFLARDRSRGAPHVLIVDHYIPQWDRDAGSRTIHHFIRMFLAGGFHVTFWPDNLYEDVTYCRELQNIGVEVIYSAAYVNRFAHFMAENGRYFDCVLLSRPNVAINYYSAVRAHCSAKVLYYGHDVHHRRMQLEMQTNPSSELEQDIEAMRLDELENWNAADVVLYPSDEERKIVLGELPDVIAAQVPMLGYTDDELATGQRNLAAFEARDADDLVFVGGSHPPNVDALLWFTREVFPFILAERPTARLNIVGSSVHDEVRLMASESIIICGRLSDEELGELYARAGVAVIPLRFGAGVKGKTVEALFNAIPFVATSVGMQGLHADAPIGLTADSAEDFAAAVIRAQSDRKEARMRAGRGLNFIAEQYSIGALTRAFKPFVSQLAAKPPAAAGEDTGRETPKDEEPPRAIMASESAD